MVYEADVGGGAQIGQMGEDLPPQWATWIG
jgi:hypothetical protein